MGEEISSAGLNGGKLLVDEVVHHVFGIERG